VQSPKETENFFQKNCLSSKCSYERVERKFDNSAKNMFAEVRKSFTQSQKSEETFKKLLFLSKCSYERVERKFDKSAKEMFAEVRKSYTQVQKLEKFSKNIFLIELFDRTARKHI